MKLLLLPALTVLAFSSHLHAEGGAFSKSVFQSRVTADISRIKATRVEGGDWDDKQDRISFKIKFENSDPNKGFEGLKYDLFIFGQSIVDRKAFKLLQRTTGEFSLPPLKSFENQTTEVVSKWDDTNAIFGDKYKGWYLLVYGPNGELVLEKSVSSFFSDPAGLPGLVEGKYYDKNLMPIKVNGR
ncbi:MAG TPA: hypothetical protein PLS03_09165 [Terrimicrobiaceae bacterium]|nr:hypothetical protein [Terrimicrobiaceae bacterium]